MPHTHTPSDPHATSPSAVASSQDKVAHPTPELSEAITRGYEPHDIGLKALFTFLGVLVVSLVVVFAIILGVMRALVDYDRSGEQVGSTLRKTDTGRSPVYAPLQPSIDHPVLDADDMTAMRAETSSKLNSAGTGENGRHYIKITDAMEKVLPLLEVHAEPIQPAPATIKLRLSDRDQLKQMGYILDVDPIAQAERSTASPK